MTVPFFYSIYCFKVRERPKQPPPQSDETRPRAVRGGSGVCAQPLGTKGEHIDAKGEASPSPITKKSKPHQSLKPDNNAFQTGLFLNRSLQCLGRLPL